MHNRRGFLKGAAVAGAGLALPGLSGGRYARAAPLAPGLSDPARQPKFVEPVLNALDPGFVLQDLNPRGSNAQGPNYRIRMSDALQQTGLIDPDTGRRLETKVWGYGQGPVSWPGPTIQVMTGMNGGPDETLVQWNNRLEDRSHLLPVDTSLHWCYSLHGHSSANGIDYRQFSIEQNGVPLITHLHGGNSDFQYDGNPEFFYSPDEIVRGPQWDFVEGGFTNTFRYSNAGPAGCNWYHDHALGITRLNVYAGLAGFYFMRDAFDTGQPDNPLGLPAFPYELAYVVQDRMFSDTGALLFPAFPGDPFYESFTSGQGVVLPESDFPGGGPTVFAEFFGDHMVVNGSIWPKVDVEPRHYRTRWLNGCDSRFVIYRFRSVPLDATDLSNAGPPLPFHVIGSDHGLASSASLTDVLIIEPGGRYDIVFDFAQVPMGTRVIIENVGPDTAFNGQFFADLTLEENQAAVDAGDLFPDRQTNLIMAFDVVRPLNSSVPDAFDPEAINFGPIPSDPVVTRRVGLFEGKEELGRLQPLLGTVADDLSSATAFTWFLPITETPILGNAELWEIYNFTADAHPIHIHLINFAVETRSEITFEVDDVNPQLVPQHDGTFGRVPAISNIQVGATVELGPQDGYVENAPKDLVTALPGQVTSLRTEQFNKPGRYVWHCHILSHEDAEMMRPLEVIE